MVEHDVTVRRVPIGLVSAYVVCGALAIAGIEVDSKLLQFVFKPLTTMLLFVILGRPGIHFQRLIALGFFFSLAGDVALLSPAKIAFMVGLVAFLAAHITYIVSFLGVGKRAPRLAAIVAIFAATTALTIKTTWAGAGPAQIPVAIYGAALTTMACSAWSTLGGRLVWPWPAAVGGTLFYIADSSLALNAFANMFNPHSELLTVGVYWVGQLGIALAARAGVQPATS